MVGGYMTPSAPQHRSSLPKSRNKAPGQRTAAPPKPAPAMANSGFKMNDPFSNPDFRQATPEEVAAGARASRLVSEFFPLVDSFDSTFDRDPVTGKLVFKGDRS